MSGKYGQKLLDHTKQSSINAHRTVSKRGYQKTAEATADLIGNKIADVLAKLYDGKTTNVSRTSPQNSYKYYTVKNEHDEELPKERYISPEERQKITDELRLI